MSKAKIIFFSLSLILASCGAKNSGNSDLAQKKTKLEQLKKQQDDLNQQINNLQAEIIKADPSANPQKAKLVAVQKIATENFDHYIDLQGKVNAQNIAYVAPRGQGGQVKALYVHEGDNVKKGQLLLTLNNDLAQQAVDQAKTQLNFAKDLYNRRSNLFKENIGTQVDLNTAKNNLDQAQHQLDQAEEQLSYSNVYAEMSGVADQVTIHVGETFTGNPAAGGYIRLVNTGDLKVTAQVPDNYIGKVKQGSTVRIVFPDINDSLTTKVAIAGKVIDPTSRTFEIQMRLPSNRNYKPNQLAEVKVLDYAATAAITVPVNTLQTDEQGKYVFVAEMKDGKMYAAKRHIEIGQLYHDQIEVKSGLAAGDMLITDGFQNLYDGQLITTAAS